MDRVCHFEVPYGDKQRAEQFYGKVFGWKFSDVPGMPYTFAFTTEVNEHHMPKQPGGINGGMYPRGDEGGSQTPVVVIEVASCAQRVSDVQSAGGSAVLGPLTVGDMGIYAQVKDSEGNIIGLWQSLAPSSNAANSDKAPAKKSGATKKKKGTAKKKTAATPKPKAKAKAKVKAKASVKAKKKK